MKLYRKMWLEVYGLIQHVDDIISPLTLTVYLYSLISVITKIFNIFTPKISTFEITRHWYTLLFQIIKVFLLTHFGSKVHEESKRTMQILNEIEPELWTTEAYLFIENTKHLKTFLTGWKIFKIHRSILLGVSFVI